MQTCIHTLLSPSLGTRREIFSLHYGTPGHGQKVYLQAGLHADELPGILVLHKLRYLLDQAEQRDEILGEIIIVPVANPVGLAQVVLYDAVGRFELGSGENFNRNYPDLLALLPADLGDHLGTDAASNRRAIRAMVGQALASQMPQTELESLRHTLFSLAYDADVVLDLHCDHEAVMHLYTEEPYWPQAELLARHLRAQTVLLARGSGGRSFDESCSGVWWQLAERFTPQGKPVPLACLSATVELRGQADVNETIAAEDAANLYAFLCERGVIASAPVMAPPLLCTPVPLAGTETLTAPHAGIISYHKQTGEWIKAGDVVAAIIDPVANQETAVVATTDGMMYTRLRRRYASRGTALVKIAGAIPLRSGNLLSP